MLFPHHNPYDAAAIEAVLTALVANQAPPRVDVSRFHSERTAELGYHQGMLHVRGPVAARAPGEITGYHIAYCCSRFGRVIPVSEIKFYGSYTNGPTYELYDDAPPDLFYVTHINPPYAIGSAGDGWREIYDAALAALT